MKLEQVIIFILLISSFFLFYYASSDKETLDTKIVRVIDGDTIVISNGEKVRFLGINTPEKGKFHSLEATQFLEGHLNENVKIISPGKDRYGRILGYVFSGKKNLNKEILERGLGHLYYYGKDSYYNSLKKAESTAREKEIGIWSRSKNYGCLEIEEFTYYDVSKDDFEKLVLKNTCNKSLDVLIKDDATHMYEETIKKKFVLTTQNIWNDDGDSIYVWDDSGILLFYRYT